GDAGMARVHFECLAAPISYGAGCAGASGFVPTLSLTGCPVEGNTVTLSIAGGLGGSTAVLMLGPTPASIPLGFGCVLLVSPVLLSLPLPLGGVGPGAGSLVLNGTIPVGSPSGKVTMQAYVLDAAAPLGASLTNG